MSGRSVPALRTGLPGLPLNTKRLHCVARYAAGCLALLWLWVPLANAASFNCTEAVSPMEKAICSDKALSAADGELAETYRRALALMAPESAAVLRADQRQWLEALERGCQLAAVEESRKDGKPVDAPDSSPAARANLKRMAGCMATPYADRTEVLRHAYAKVDGVAFTVRSLTLLSPDRSPDATENGGETFPGFGSMQVSWPEAQSAEDRWLAWNAALVQTLQKTATPGGKPQRPGWHDSMAADTDSSVTARVPVLAHGRVSVAVARNDMGHGAAHPSEEFFQFTWLLDARRELTPQDVFKAGSAWRQALADRAWADLSHGDKRQSLYDPQQGTRGKALLEVVGDVRNWTIGPRGLQIGWPEYSLSPRAAPLDDTVVPWAVLRPLLAPGFVP